MTDTLIIGFFLFLCFLPIFNHWADVAFLTDAEKQVLRALWTHGDGLTIHEVAQLCEQNGTTTWATLEILSGLGRVSLGHHRSNTHYHYTYRHWTFRSLWRRVRR